MLVTGICYFTIFHRLDNGAFWFLYMLAIGKTTVSTETGYFAKPGTDGGVLVKHRIKPAHARGID
jgi:hypothetical protein